MIRIPRLKNHLRIKIVPPDLCLFLHETGYSVLQGRLISLIAPLINGKNSVSNIAKRLKNELTAFDIECGLLLLEDEGLLSDSNDAPPAGLDIFFDLLSITSKAFTSEIKKARVGVVSFGEVSATAFSLALQKLGIRVTKKNDLTIVLVDDYLRIELKDFNQYAIRKKLQWMIVKPTGTVFWFGPTFSPPHTACWECMARRLSENLRAETFPDALESYSPQPESSTIHAALNWAAIETLEQLVLQNHKPLSIHTLDTQEMKIGKHLVVKSEQCGSCVTSKTEKAFYPRIILKSCKKGSSAEQRSISAEQTFQKYEHLISPLTGIVDQVKLSKSNCPLYLSTASHPFVLPLEKESPSSIRLKRKSAGKGTTPQQAMTGVLCEALERYSGIFRGDELRIKAAYKELRDEAIHPNACLNFSETQYSNREKWNQSNTGQDWVPIPFYEKRTIEWTPVWSLTESTVKYVPTAYCYYGYPMPRDQRFCRADSNGNAAGNTIEEAILQGFMELVERDATALWWYNRIPRSLINLDSLQLPYIKALDEHYRMLGRSIWLFDIASDFNIPAFAAVSAHKRSMKSDFLFGFAAHFNPLVAASRALMEMNQFLSRPAPVRRKARLDFLHPNPSMPQKSLEDSPLHTSNDFLKDIKTCVKLAHARGMETLILNQTRADIELPVAKVIVPGMRQFWARFGKGRLYNIPVQLGWLKTPLTENQLNPNRLLI